LGNLIQLAVTSKIYAYIRTVESRKHAVINIGDHPEDCTIEDLGSTNKSALASGDGNLITLNPGTTYP
jgi:hypothetical protein